MAKAHRSSHPGMPSGDKVPGDPPLLLIAGAKGAVGSTVAAAVCALGADPHSVMPWLTTGSLQEFLGSPAHTRSAGWDSSPKSLRESLEGHKVLPREMASSYKESLDGVRILQAPDTALPLRTRVEQLARDIEMFRGLHPGTSPVFVNLLPAARPFEAGMRSMEQLYSSGDAAVCPDLAYVLASIASGVPVVNFTSNPVELPVIVDEAFRAGISLCGRDGKTGQTYLKVVLASALKARSLQVDGWYSLNILGNEDGRTLADPEKAAGKLANKTGILDEILGYPVGLHYGMPTHKVAIDYYPPRGDCKEAWDVIDFTGLFGLPMSLRLNLLARDSILAAPLVLDLARWMVCLKKAGRSGPVPELGFYFKKPVGTDPPKTFSGQLAALERLEAFCRQSIQGT